MATRVELSTRILVGGVQRYNFMANEIVPARDTLGDFVLYGGARFLESIGGPDVRSILTTFLLDLKPDSPACGVNMVT